MIYLGNSEIAKFRYWGIQLLRGQDEGGGGQNMSVFVHAQGIKIVHALEGGSKNGKILST